MNKRLIIVAVLSCVGFFSSPPIFAQKHQVEVINVAATSEGDKIRGPRSIKPVYVNRIRYRVAAKTKTTFTAGPSLALPFIPQIPGGGGSGGGASAADNAQAARQLNDNLDAARKANDPEGEFQVIRLSMQNLITRRADIQNLIAPLLTDTKTARDATEGLVRESDALLAGAGGPIAVLDQLPDVIQKIQNAEGSWPDDAINRFLADVDIWESELGRISNLQWLAANKDRVDAVKTRFKELRESITGLSRQGPADGPAARFDEAQKVLGQWKAIFLEAQRQKKEYFELP